MTVFKLDLYHGTKSTKMEAVALTCSTRTLNQQFYKIYVKTWLCMDSAQLQKHGNFERRKVHYKEDRSEEIT